MAKKLTHLLASVIPNGQEWQVYLISQWPTIMGTLHNQVRLEKLNHDTLIMGVYDTHWMQELYMLAPMLIDRINNSLEKPYIKHIRLKKVERPKAKSASPRSQPKDAIRKKRELTERELTCLTNIDDTELSHALRGFLERCHDNE